LIRIRRTAECAALLCLLWVCEPAPFCHGFPVPCLDRIGPRDSLVVADSTGRILCGKNETAGRVPASTLKLLTALAALHHLGPEYRFRTEFYLDRHRNLIMKGYGDPLLISESLREIARDLANRLGRFRDLVLDDTYFSPNIEIPGSRNSTNPYDAPVGALCANFNTVFFEWDTHGRIVSAEPQTPMLPFVQEKIFGAGLTEGRYTFSHDPRDSSRYAAELLLHFLRREGVEQSGTIRRRPVNPQQDRPILTWESQFPLKSVIRKMMQYSNNFIANQILVSVGARIYDPPGTLAKGVRAVSRYAGDALGLNDIRIVEGSGISRANRVSAVHMLSVLKRFMPHRHLLTRKGNILFKTGSLRDISTRAGYIERAREGPYLFVVFLGRGGPDMGLILNCIERAVLEHGAKIR
jgi:serine-type D-Ala-D-Ala carboxypeptidase/endopeptidase (penicillin-binding protein 4)